MKHIRPRNESAQALQSKIFSNKVLPSKKQKAAERERKSRPSVESDI